MLGLLLWRGKNLFWKVMGSDILCPGKRASSQPSQALFATLSQQARDRLLCWVRLAAFQPRTECNAEAIKQTIFRLHFNLNSAQAVRCKVWRWPDQGDASTDRIPGKQVREKTKEVSLSAEKEAPRGLCCCLRCKRQKRGSRPSCVVWGVTKEKWGKGRKERLPKRLGQCAPGEPVKNMLPWSTLGLLSPNIRVGRGNLCF